MNTGKPSVQELEYHLTDEDLAELNTVIDKVKGSGRRLEDITKDEFPLPTLGPKVKAIHDDLIFGRGIRVLKNLPLGPPNSERCALAKASSPCSKEQLRWKGQTQGALSSFGLGHHVLTQ